MNKYVLGFAFSPDLAQVILIQKQKPDWQHGKFNGVGGKIENGEASIDAMVREFHEETGVVWLKWHEFVRMEGTGWECFCFFSILDRDAFNKAKTIEDELLVKASATKLPTNCMRNIHWLVPMAINWDKDVQKVIYT